MFPLGGDAGWNVLGGTSSEDPVARPLPSALEAVWYDPSPLGGTGAPTPSTVRRIGASSAVVKREISLEATLGQPEVFGTVLLDRIDADLNPWLPFPFRMLWPIQEGYSFLTDVLASADGHEQRRAPRNPAQPRRGIKAVVRAFERDESEHLMALLFGWNAHAYGVPYWMHATRLTSAAGIGDTVLAVQDATQRDYLDGRLALVWRAHDEWEVVTITSWTSTTVTLRDPLQADWFLSRFEILLVPLRLGWLPEQMSLVRFAPHRVDVEVDFLIEAAP